MTEVQFRSDMDVKLISSTPEPDRMVIAAARVSTLGALSETSDFENPGLINFLMKNRHGSPFEHASFTFLVSAPIFVWREIMRHRIASYNEESGRYKQLEPVFYIPAKERPLQQQGKAGHYEFVEGTEGQKADVEYKLAYVAQEAYAAYLHMLEGGVAREVARMCLPLNIYSSAYITMNARGLMNFLSLRTKREGSKFPSFPQVEIQLVAEHMETLWSDEMPYTADAFDKNGRVCP